MMVDLLVISVDHEMMNEGDLMKGIRQFVHGILSFDIVHLYSLCSTNFGCQNDTQLISTEIGTFDLYMHFTTESYRKLATNILAFWKMGVTLTPIFEFWPALKASDRTRFQETVDTRSSLVM